MTFFLGITFITSWLNQVERHYFGVEKGVVLDGIPVTGLLEDELQDLVEEMAIRYQRTPVEPMLDKISAAVIPPKNGVVIDIQKTVAKTMAAEPYTKVTLVRVTIPTRYQEADLLAADKTIASYHTYLQGSAARINNIRVAVRSMNNTVIWPGEAFSFNEVSGPRTAERGYLPAPIILQGGFNMGLGGGVCQVSSTLYNAALQAGLPILERHPHTRPVHYVPPGRDATVNYGSLDMRFQNNRSGPIIIKMSVYGGKIQAQILGGEKE